MANPATAAESAQLTPETGNSKSLPEPVSSSRSSSSATALEISGAATSDADENRDVSEPGFHVVRKPMSRSELQADFYGDASAKPDNFDRLNPGPGSRVLPGERIVVADPRSLECTAEENDLMDVAASWRVDIC